MGANKCSWKSVVLCWEVRGNHKLGASWTNNNVGLHHFSQMSEETYMHNQYYLSGLGKCTNLSPRPTLQVTAKDPLPPFPASIKDGYAVIASDGAGVRQVGTFQIIFQSYFKMASHY